MPVLDAPLVAAEALFQAFDRLIHRGIGVMGVALGLQRDAGRQVQDEIGPEARTVGLDRHMPRGFTIEILRDRRTDLFADVLLQRLADVDVLTGHAQQHGSPPSRWLSPGPAPRTVRWAGDVDRPSNV